LIGCDSDCDEVLEADSLISWEREVPVKLRMAETGPLSEKPICVMTALRTTAEKYPSHPALGLYLCCLPLYIIICYLFARLYIYTKWLEKYSKNQQLCGKIPMFGCKEQ